MSLLHAQQFFQRYPAWVVLLQFVAIFGGAALIVWFFGSYLPRLLRPKCPTCKTALERTATDQWKEESRSGRAVARLNLVRFTCPKCGWEVERWVRHDVPRRPPVATSDMRPTPYLWMLERDRPARRPPDDRS